MLPVITAVLAALVPFAAVMGLLWLAGRVQRRRERARERQIALTDALHGELGAVVAPTVERRLGGGWRVSMTAPFDRPATVAAVVAVTRRFFARQDDAGARPLELVLREAMPAARSLGRPVSSYGAAPETDLKAAA